MKRILFRVAVLGTVVTLGLIALAQTQQRGSPPNGAGAAFVADDTAAPYASSADTAVNPLRPAGTALADTTIPDAQSAGARPLAGDAPPGARAHQRAAVAEAAAHRSVCPDSG